MLHVPTCPRLSLTSSGTMDQLGMVDVHVAAGTDGGASGDAESIAKMTAVDYLSTLAAAGGGGDRADGQPSAPGGRPVDHPRGDRLKRRGAAAAQRVGVVLPKLKEVVIMGGVESFTPGKAAEGVLLKPDSAHNNEFDRESSSFVYQTLQERGVPMAVVSRFAAYACQVPKTIFDQMADTGSRIGVHLRSTQRYAMEKLWQRASAPRARGYDMGCPHAATGLGSSRHFAAAPRSWRVRLRQLRTTRSGISSKASTCTILFGALRVAASSRPSSAQSSLS